MACLFCPISDRTYGYFDTNQSLEKQGKDPQLKTHPTMILSDISANSLSQLEKFTVEGINNESSVAKNEWTSWPEFSWYDCGSFLLTYAENSLRCMFFLLPQGPFRVKIAILFWLWLGKKSHFESACTIVYECIQSRRRENDYAPFNIFRSARWRIYLDSKVHGTNTGPIWGGQDPGGPMLAPRILLSVYASGITGFGNGSLYVSECIIYPMKYTQSLVVLCFSWLWIITSVYDINETWWLWVVPTSTARFFSDVGYRMAKIQHNYTRKIFFHEQWHIIP